MIAFLFTGCGGRVLEPGFEVEIEQGWVCEGWGQPIGPPSTGDTAIVSLFYVALDQAESFRVQAKLSKREATFPADEDFFSVLTGAGLIVDRGDDKCDDVILGGRQRIDYLYTAISGTARAVDDGDRVGLEVEGIVLRPDNRLLDDSTEGAPGWESLPDVVVRDGRLPSFAPSGS